MSFFCVCFDAGPNKSFEIQKEDPKYLTTIDILKKVNPDADNGENENDISKFIWYKTPRCAVNLKDDECPLKNYPSLVLSERPDLYETLPESLQIFTSLSSTEIQNGHPGYSIFYLNVKHTTGHNIPRIFLPVITKKMSRSSHELYDIINESFAILGSVETKAIYKGNGEQFIQTNSVHTVLDELQQLDKNQKECEKDKKKNTNLEAEAQKNVTAEIEFSEGALQKLQQRSSLSEDILNTEKRYIECLRVLDQFWGPKLKEQSLLTDDEYDYIFKDIKTIMSSHQAFCSTLEKAVRGYGSEFGRLFLSYAPFFKISADYISKYPLINKMIEKKDQDSPEFTKTIKNLAKEAPDNSSQDDLSSYLIQPVKRFPYYSNFLKSVMKVTPKNHPDAPFLPLAKKEISDFISQVEEKADRTTKNAIMMNIQVSNSDGFDYVTPQRTLTQSFNVSYIPNQASSTNDKKQNKELKETPGIFHVCNDYTFLVNQETSKCIYKSPLLQFHYFNSPNANTITVSTIKDGINTDDCVTKSYDVQFQNQEEETNFFSLIEPQAEQKAGSTTLPNRSFLWKAKKTNSELNPVSDHKSIFNGSQHVFYGGCRTPNSGDTEYYSNFVLYNNGNVSEIESGIKGRRLHTFTNVNGKLFVIGGETASGNKNGTMLVYDDENKGWQSVDCPELSQLSGHSAAVHGKDEIIIYGGALSFDEVYSVNTTTYEVKSLPIESSQNKDQNNIPQTRYGHSAIIHNDKMYVYGGRSSETDQILSDLWSFDFTQNKWSLIKWDLLPKSSHTALKIGDEMVIIGGEGSNQSFSINLNDNTVKFIDEYGNLPTNLIGSSVSYDPTNKTIVVYGGRESTGGPSTSALYELKMSQDWEDSVPVDQEVVERDIITDLSPKFIEIDENGNVNEVQSPEDEADQNLDENNNNNIINEEEEVELEVEVEFDEEEGTQENNDGNENADQNQNNIEDFNYSEDKAAGAEGEDNQKENVYSNDMDFDEIIDDLKKDEKNDENLGKELLGFNSENQEEEQQNENENVQEKGQEQQDDEKLSTEPQNEEEDDDLLLDEILEEEDNVDQSTPQKNPWELASDDIQDGLSDDHSNVNNFEPDENQPNQNEEEEGNQFEPDEDNKANKNEEESEQEGNQFEPDEDNKANKNEEESEQEGNQFEPDEENEGNGNEEETENEGNQFEPDEDNNNGNEEEENDEDDSQINSDELDNLSDEEEDDINSDEINDAIDGIDDLEKELEESKKLQDQNKSDKNNENEEEEEEESKFEDEDNENISSDIGTDKLSEDLGKSDDVANDKLSTNSEEENENEEGNINDSENKDQDENNTSNDFQLSDNSEQKVSSSSHHRHSSSNSPSRGHHHHHHSSSSRGHSHHHSSRKDSSDDYMHHQSSSSHRRHHHDYDDNNRNDNNNDFDMDSNSSSNTDDLMNSSSHSNSSSAGGSKTPSFIKKPTISKEKKKELERRKKLMNDPDSVEMSSSSFSPSHHKKHHRNDGGGMRGRNSDLSFGDMSDNSDDSYTPSFQEQNKRNKEKYRFTTFGLQKTNCSYLQNNQQNNNSPYGGGGGYQSPGSSRRRNNDFGSGSGSRMSSFGGSNSGFGNNSSNTSAYYSPTPRARLSNNSSASYYNNSSISNASATPTFNFTSPRRRNFNFESGYDDDQGFNDDEFSSPSRNLFGASSPSYSSSSNYSSGRSGKSSQFVPHNFMNDSPFSRKNRSNNPLYATSTNYGPKRHNDE